MNNKKIRYSRFLGLLSIVLASVALAQAEVPEQVARIAFVSGSVSFRPAELDDWNVAPLNYPMTTGDNLWTDAGGRAELRAGSMAVRLSSDTSITIFELGDNVAQWRLAQGTASVSLRSLRAGEIVEIDLPNASVSLLSPGFYRFDVGGGGAASTITVRQGQAEVTTGGAATLINNNQAIVVAGLIPGAPMRSAIRADEWEDWCQWRDRRAANSVAVQYVSPDLVGYEDLDEFGAWQTVGVYGPVWVPHVRSGWAPYRDGHWAWVEPWGWTWIDDAPWGFAPSHYGRWVSLPGGWAWVPGARAERPIYAPALVVFVGGPELVISASFGTPVAWFPLGPREPYIPSYRAGPEYVRAINVAHVNVTNVQVTNINITYVNRSVTNAVTVVSRDTFVQGRPVGRAAAPVSVEVVRRGTILGTAAPLAPERSSIVGQARRGAAPPAAVIDRQVIVRRPPAAPPVKFEARQQALAAHPGKPVDDSEIRALRTQQASAPATHPLVAAVATAPVRSPNVPPAARNPAPPKSAAPKPVPPGQTAVTPVPERADLAARHAAERADLEAQHAAQQADLKARQAAAQQKAPDNGARPPAGQQRPPDTVARPPAGQQRPPDTVARPPVDQQKPPARPPTQASPTKEEQQLQQRQIQEHRQLDQRQKKEDNQKPPAKNQKPPAKDEKQPPDKKK